MSSRLLALAAAVLLAAAAPIPLTTPQATWGCVGVDGVIAVCLDSVLGAAA